MKEKALKWFLIISGLIQICYWGISHLFFPQWYLRSIGLVDLAENPGTTIIFLNEIGVLTTGLGLATIIAALNPVRYFPLIAVLYLVAIGSMAVSVYHITTGNMVAGEWTTVIVLAIQIMILTLLYPWPKLRKERP